GRRQLPGEQVQRQVPGTDHPDHAQRLAQGVVQGAGRGMRLAGELGGGVGEEAQVGHRPRDVQSAGQGQRLAGVARFGGGEFVQARFQGRGQLLQPGGAFGGGQGGPGGEGGAGGGGGGIDVGG